MLWSINHGIVVSVWSVAGGDFSLPRSFLALDAAARSLAGWREGGCVAVSAGVTVRTTYLQSPLDRSVVVVVIAQSPAIAHAELTLYSCLPRVVMATDRRTQ